MQPFEACCCRLRGLINEMIGGVRETRSAQHITHLPYVLDVLLKSAQHITHLPYVLDGLLASPALTLMQGAANLMSHSHNMYPVERDAAHGN